MLGCSNDFKVIKKCKRRKFTNYNLRINICKDNFIFIYLTNLRSNGTSIRNY